MSYVVPLPNCRHVVVVTTYHSIILAKRMVRNHRNQPQTTLNNMVKRGGQNGRPYNPPWPLAPQPFCPLFDCCVVVVWDQAAQLHSATWSQNRCALNPTRPKKWTKSPHKTEAATPSPGGFSPNPVVLRLIVMFSAIVTGRIVRFRQPG